MPIAPSYLQPAQSTAGQRSILSMSKSTFIATFTGRIVFGSTVTEDDMYRAPPDIIAQFSAAVLDAMLSRRTRNATQGPHAPPLSFDPNPILSTATTLFTRAAKSAHFLADREEKRLSIMYHGWTPSPSPTDKWEAAWLEESGAFCNTSTSRLTLRCRLPKQIEHILQGAFPSPRCLGEHSPNAPNPAAPGGNGRGGLGIDISKPPISIRLMARSDPANAPRALTPVPMMLHNTPAGPHSANRIRPYHGGMGDPSLLTDTRQLPSQPYPRAYTRQSVSNLLLLQRALTPPGCRAQTAIMPLMTPLPAALRRTHTSSIHTQGNGPARIRPLLPSHSHYHPLPSLIGPATAAVLTNTRAHAHLYHHLHSRFFAYPSQGHPPCRHMHQLPPLLGLPSSTTTPLSQSQTYPLAAQQQHWRRTNGVLQSSFCAIWQIVAAHVGFVRFGKISQICVTFATIFHNSDESLITFVLFRVISPIHVYFSAIFTNSSKKLD